jgi:tetratricopeptide (TPR) repeat protein
MEERGRSLLRWQKEVDFIRGVLAEETQLFCISAPPGGGKTTFFKELYKSLSNDSLFLPSYCELREDESLVTNYARLEQCLGKVVTRNSAKLEMKPLALFAHLLPTSDSTQSWQGMQFHWLPLIDRVIQPEAASGFSIGRSEAIEHLRTSLRQVESCHAGNEMIVILVDVRGQVSDEMLTDIADLSKGTSPRTKFVISLQERTKSQTKIVPCEWTLALSPLSPEKVRELASDEAPKCTEELIEAIWRAFEGNQLSTIAALRLVQRLGPENKELRDQQFTFDKLSQLLYDSLDYRTREVVNLLAIVHCGAETVDIASILDIPEDEVRLICYNEPQIVQEDDLEGKGRQGLLSLRFKQVVLSLIGEEERTRLSAKVGTHYMRMVSKLRSDGAFGELLAIRGYLFEGKSPLFVSAVISTLSVAVLLGCIEGSKKYVTSALAQSRKDEDRGALLYAMSLDRLQRNELEEAIDLCRQALSRVRTSNGSPILEALVLNTLSYMFQQTRRVKEALLCEEQGLERFRQFMSETGFRANAAPYLSNIGLLHQELGDSAKALKCYQDALREDVEAKNSIGAASDWRRIGAIFQDTKDYAAALSAYKSALDLDSGAENTTGIGWDFGNLGSVCLLMGEHSEAKRWLQLAQRVLKDHGSEKDLANVRALLGNLEESTV